MLLLFILLIGQICPIEVPKFQYIFIQKTGDESNCPAEDNEMIQNKEELKKACAGNPEILGGKEMCDAVAEAYSINLCYFIDEGNTVNSVLSQIDTSASLIHIANTVAQEEQTVDFNELKAKKDVIFSQYQLSEDQLGTIHLIGGIKNKISSLVVREIKFDIVDSDLDIDTLTLSKSEFLPANSKKILSNNLLIQEQNIDFSALSSLVQSNLVQFFDESHILEPNEQIEIKFSKDHLTIIKQTGSYEIPYSFANTLGMITIASKITFSSEQGFEIPENFALNLTFKVFFPYACPESFIVWSEEPDDSYPKTIPILLEKSADWNEGSRKPKIIVYSDLKIYSVDTTGMDDVANIEIIDSSDDQSTDDGGEVTPTSEPTEVPDGSLNENDVKEVTITNADQTSSIISDEFKKQNYWDESKDRVVSISGDSFEEYPINLKMEENEFISSSTNTAKFDLQGENLNLLMTKNNEITVRADTTTEVGISVKGGGKLIIEPKATNPDIKFKSKMKLDSSLSVEVNSEGINSLTIDSISIFKSEQPIQVTARNSNDQMTLSINQLEVMKGAVSTLKNCDINQKVLVDESSSLTLENVNLKSAQLLLNISTSYKKPLIEGNLKDEPQQFSINKVEGKPAQETDYVLIKAIFNCEKWKSKLVLDGTGFDDKICQAISGNAISLEEEQQQLIIKKRKDDNDDKNKLKTGEIVGIVVGCVAFVAIIVVIVVVVLVKKKKAAVQNNSSP